MKARRFPLLVLLTGLLIAAFGLVLPIIMIRTGGAATGIIGGADTPTYWHVVKTVLGGFPLWLDLIGTAMILTSLPAVFFIKSFQRACNLNTSLCTLGISASGGLGLMCVIVSGVYSSLGAPHDDFYFILIFLGLVALFGFLSMICVYFEARAKKSSFLGFIYDVVTSILYLPAFFFLFMFVPALF